MGLKRFLSAFENLVVGGLQSATWSLEGKERELQNWREHAQIVDELLASVEVHDARSIVVSQIGRCRSLYATRLYQLGKGEAR